MKLLIADDEINIRMGLSKSVNWGSLGIDSVYTARDGEEACRICEEHRIELILTDIRMPEMDGLEIVKRLHYTPYQVIIMSGYAEFEYAREALKLGVTEYLLKPINIEELKEVVKKCISRIESSHCASSILGSPVSKGLEAHQLIFGGDPKLSLSENTFDSSIIQAFIYINDHYMEHLTIEDVAGYLGKSNNYFSSNFKKKAGISFVEYLTRIRVRHAGRILRTTNLMTYEVAEATGFSDYKHFSTVFKSETGLTPSEYRKNYENLKK